MCSDNRTQQNDILVQDESQAVRWCHSKQTLSVVCNIISFESQAPGPGPGPGIGTPHKQVRLWDKSTTNKSPNRLGAVILSMP